MTESIDQAESLAADIKLVLFDVDGTLLDAQGRYSAELESQLARLRQRGVKTAIASGRPVYGARFLINELGLSDAGSFCSGSHLYDPRRQQTLQSVPIEQPVNQRLLQRLRQIGAYYEVYTESGFYVDPAVEQAFTREHASHLRASPESLDLHRTVLDAPVIKWLAGVSNRVESRTALRQLESEFPELIFAYGRFPARPDWCLANVISARASKADAFRRLLAYHDVQPEQVASFGDSHSDMDFLRLAGWGVALGNASDRVKSAARFVTRSVEENGVVYALRRLFCE